jgi:hypothetical protein
MTLEQVKALQYHDRVHYGCCRVGSRIEREVWRVSGPVRVWTSRPDDVAVPISLNGTHSYIRPYNMDKFHLPEECPLHLAAS